MPAAKKGTRATNGRSKSAQEARDEHMRDMAKDLRIAMGIIEELVWMVPGEKGEDLRRRFYGK